jgi:hypothetical protein
LQPLSDLHVRIDAADHRNQSSVGHLGHRSLLFGLLRHRCGDVWNDGWISLCLLSRESLSQKQNVRKISLDLFCVRNSDCRIGSARNPDSFDFRLGKNLGCHDGGSSGASWY